MSGIHMALLAGRGQVIVPQSMAISQTVSDPADASGTISMIPDGTWSYSFGASGSVAWFSPAGDESGRGLHVRFVLNSGTGPTIGTTGSWLPVYGVARSWHWQQSTAGSQSASVTVQFSGDGGTTVIYSFTFSVALTVS